MLLPETHIDNELLHRWQNGDENGFITLYRKYYPLLLNIAFKKLNSFEVAEELTQDAFVKLYLKPDYLKDNPLAYLKTIIRNSIIDHYRTSGKIIFLPVTNEAKDIHYSVDNTSAALNLSELNGQLYAAIQQLPEQCRKIFLLSREKEMSYRDIAEQLGLSVKTVEAHMSKALKFLRTHIEYCFYWFLLVSSFVYMLVMHVQR